MKFMIQQDDLQLLKENTGHMANKMQFNSVSGRYCCVTPVLSLREKKECDGDLKEAKNRSVIFSNEDFCFLGREEERAAIKGRIKLL